jgi:hypothetical protein
VELAKLERDIKKVRAELDRLISINGCNLINQDIQICSKRLDSLLIKYQRLRKCTVDDDTIKL